MEALVIIGGAVVGLWLVGKILNGLYWSFKPLLGVAAIVAVLYFVAVSL